MTKKDFELIAEVLNRVTPINKEEENYKQMVVLAMARELNRDNERFDHARFILACYGR